MPAFGKNDYQPYLLKSDQNSAENFARFCSAISTMELPKEVVSAAADAREYVTTLAHAIATARAEREQKSAKKKPDSRESNS